MDLEVKYLFYITDNLNFERSKEMKVIIKEVEKFIGKEKLDELKKAEDVHMIHRGHAIDLEIRDDELASFVLAKKFPAVF